MIFVTLQELYQVSTEGGWESPATSRLIIYENLHEKGTFPKLNTEKCRLLLNMLKPGGDRSDLCEWSNKKNIVRNYLRFFFLLDFTYKVKSSH